MTQPIPTPLPPWARVLLQVLPFIAAGLQTALDYIGEMQHGGSGTPDEWRKVLYDFGDPASLDPADQAVTGFDVVNITNGDIDNSWIQADMDKMHLELDALVAVWTNGYLRAPYRCLGRRTYRMQFSPLGTEDPISGKDKPFLPSGAPVEVGDAVGSVGIAARMPSQIAITTTELTPYRKHWGRNYWPFPHTNTCSTTGHISAGVVDAMATAKRLHYGNLMAAELYPVVPVTQIQKTPARGLLGVTEVQVDDIFDVQRRRRLKNTTRISIAGAEELRVKEYARQDPA